MVREVLKVVKGKRKECKFVEKNNLKVDEGEKKIEKISDEKDLLDFVNSDFIISGL